MTKKLLIELDLSQGMEANASAYFDRAKAAEAKARAIEAAMENLMARAAGSSSARDSGASAGPRVLFAKAKPAWFEAFHWILSSDGFLVVAGRDAKGNEELVKKHLQKDDFFLHADIVGAASTVILSNRKPVSDAAFEEAAQLAAACSRAWRMGNGVVDVYAVSPDQVSKSAPSGESMGTGAFMIYGERRWFRKTALEWAVGVYEVSPNRVRLMGGAPSAVARHCKAFVNVRLGTTQASDAAKQIKKRLEGTLGRLPFSLDDFVRRLPAGGLDVGTG